jgi:ATP diphosphatase
MQRLRDPARGCEWDKQQTFETIAPIRSRKPMRSQTRSSAAIWTHSRTNCGDLLLQVIYHTQIAEERGAFDLDDVMEAICDKLVRRHPHIFGSDNESPGWEALKAAERSEAADQSALAGVARSLPALKRRRKGAEARSPRRLRLA